MVGTIQEIREYRRNRFGVNMSLHSKMLSCKDTELSEGSRIRNPES